MQQKMSIMTMNFLWLMGVEEKQIGMLGKKGHE